MKKALGASINLLGELDGVRGVVIATADGLVLAHTGRLGAVPARLAAIAASLVELGQAAATAVGTGRRQRMVLEGTEGRTVIGSIGVRGMELAVVLVADKTLLLGMAWSGLSRAQIAMNAD
jgi:hypothetical protein